LQLARNNTLVSAHVTGLIPMSQAQAQTLISSGHGIVYRLWGDDPVLDDMLSPDSSFSRYLWATPEGLRFQAVSLTLRSSLLNEDPLPFDRDEIYAAVRLLTSSRALKYRGESNVVYGRF
jgi:hypothetical protein